MEGWERLVGGEHRAGESAEEPEGAEYAEREVRVECSFCFGRYMWRISGRLRGVDILSFQGSWRLECAACCARSAR
jgi:hypothetical protein